MSDEPIERYGAKWPGTAGDLEIEMACIRRGGAWVKEGQACGLGLVHHYEQMRRILWPQLDDHRWHRLCRDEILRNKVTVLMGPGSSGKTHEAAWFYLCEYLVFPDETCVLVSSTDLRGLRLRVWGEITMLWEQARERFDFLPGNMLDAKPAIATDAADEKSARDLRKGILGIPCVQNGKFVGLGKYCFPQGTLVDTEQGPVRIELVKPGDRVIGAAGSQRVAATHHRTAERLARITLVGGETIDCTPEHPFLTQWGFVNAIDLLPQHQLISAHEAMQILREGADDGSRQPEILRRVPTRRLGKKVPAMRDGFHPHRGEGDILLQVLRGEMEDDAAGDREAHDLREGFGGGGQGHQPRHTTQHGGLKPPPAGRTKTGGKMETDGTAALWRQRNQPAQCQPGGTGLAGHFPEGKTQSPNFNGTVIEAGHGATILDGFGVAGDKIGRGGGWGLSPSSRSTPEGRRPRPVFKRAWVDRVEILQPSSDRRYDPREGGYQVHNLQVEAHPSYSVQGWLTHNCGIKQKRVRLIADEAQFMGAAFLSAFANLDKNEDFRAVVMGNPNDPNDPLGKAAEPKDGWGAHMEPAKTSVWDTRFMNGRCVNLIGTDSPNFDFPEHEPAHYKYLISREKIANTLSFFSRDSMEYQSQCVGSMKTSMLSRRVLTRELCQQFGAFGPVTWKGTPLVKIGALDAAYGGDRCVGGHIEFGLDLNGKVVVNVLPPQIVPVRAGAGGEPEDQIAEWVKEYCGANGIPPENFFHDATGRGSLGTSLARVWSALTNPVEFGGLPSGRPVCLDLFLYDEKTRSRRLKLCSEHYLNFVTELWYSVRYAVEAGQMRNLPEEVAEELFMRKWDKVNNNRIKVEPKTGTADKPGMKQRTGRSPDLGDWLAIAVEGARRRGFQISKLANGEEDAKGWDWLDDLARQQKDLRARRQLVFS